MKLQKALYKYSYLQNSYDDKTKAKKASTILLDGKILVNLTKFMMALEVALELENVNVAVVLHENFSTVKELKSLLEVQISTIAEL